MVASGRGCRVIIDAITAAQSIEEVRLTTLPDIAALMQVWVRKGKPHEGRHFLEGVMVDTLGCCWPRVKTWMLLPAQQYARVELGQVMYRMVVLENNND